MTENESPVLAVTDLIKVNLVDNIVGIYLFGTSIAGGLKPRSDIDIFAVSRRPLRLSAKRGLVSGLLAISGKPRSIELTVVAQSEIRPWHYPPSFDLQYGEWIRDSFEHDNPNALLPKKTPDLAILIHMIFLHHQVLYGAKLADAIDPIPRHDLVQAIVDATADLLDDIDWDTCNVLLSLARSWCTITYELLPKDEAAAWAIERLPEEYKGVLAHARKVYLGLEQESWVAMGALLQPCATFLISQIKTAASAELNVSTP